MNIQKLIQRSLKCSQERAGVIVEVMKTEYTIGLFDWNNKEDVIEQAKYALAIIEADSKLTEGM